MKRNSLSIYFFLFLNILLLTLVLLASKGLVGNRKITVLHPQAGSGSVTANGVTLSPSGSNLNGSHFTGHYHLQNSNNFQVQISVDKESYWCDDPKSPNGSCGDHSWTGSETFTLEAVNDPNGHDKADFTIDSNNGDGSGCGSFQVDAYLEGNNNPVWHYDGYGRACEEPTPRASATPGGPTVTPQPTATPTPPRLACNASCDPQNNQCNQLCPLCVSNGFTNTCQGTVACNQSCVNDAQCPQNCSICTGQTGNKTCRPPVPTSTPTPTPLVCGSPCNPNHNVCPVGCSLCVGAAGSTRCTAPTPTPAQVTSYITQIPVPSLSKKANQNPQGRPSQKWVCLEALPCSKTDSHCPAVADLGHKAKIMSKSNSWEKSTPNKQVYIYECIKTAAGIKCTSGDSNRDLQTTGYDNLPYLVAAPYHYQGQKLFQANGITNQPQPVNSDGNGDIGTYIWESHVDISVEHLFYAMNELNPGEGDFIGAQQQSDINVPRGTSTNCRVIKWDPYGRVIDNKTGDPINNVTLTLLKKTAEGTFIPLNGDEVIGGVTNPYMTAENGEFDFTVPDGVYKLEVQSPRYTFLTDKSKITSDYIDKGSTAYTGQEIVIKGGRRQFTILMERKPSFLEQLNESLRKLLQL